MEGIRPRQVEGAIEIVSFTLLGSPNRIREDAVRGAAADAMIQAHYERPIGSPVLLRLSAVFPIPEVWSASQKAFALTGDIHPAGPPALSEVIETCVGAMTGTVIAGASQIVSTVASKTYGRPPRIAITVQSMPRPR